MTPAADLALSGRGAGDRGFLILLGFIVIVTLCALGFVLASLFLRWRNNRVARRWAGLEARWDPVMLDVLAGAAPAAALHALVRPPDHRWFVEFLLRYGRRIRGHERDVLSQLAAPYLYAVSGDLRHRSVERRAQAVQAIGQLGRAAYRAELVTALEDPAPIVVVIAAVALSREYRADDVRQVIKSVNRLELLTNRLLVSVLRRLGSESAWAFREVLGDSTQSAKLRTVAAKVLAHFNDQESGPFAVEAVDQTDDLDLRVAALQILERIGVAEHLPVVRRLAQDPAPAVRGAAIRILARVGEEQDLQRLVTALDDPVSWVAIHAAEGLRQSGRTDLLEQVAAAHRRRSSIIVSEVLFRDAG